MSEISKEELRSKIIEILSRSDSDIYAVTPKSIRTQLEKELGYSLLSQKVAIKNIATEEIQKLSKAQEESESKDEKSSESSAEEEVEKPKRARASAPAKKAPVKRKRKAANGNNSDSDDNDNDEDYKSTKKSKKTTNGPKKGTGFTRPYTLSPQLSALMGAESLPRHEVVKKVWAIIKERNLYDPKNKQYAICDAELFDVMKIKRFRTFGMLKYLKPHFLD